MINPKYLSVLFSLSLGFVVSLPLSTVNAKTVDDAVEPLPLEVLKEFTDAFASIKSDYVEVVDDKTILKNAIKGMMSGLDPHSSYLDEKSFKHLKEGTTGEFGGLGIEVGMEDGLIKVIAPIDDTPAQRAGIMSGDLIFRIDDKPVKDMELDESVKLMRGKPGSEIELSIIREGHDEPLKFTLKRAIIKVKSVKSRILEEGFAYLRISSFQSRTAEQLKKALKKLVKENDKQALKGLILDLRNNPGGVLNGSVDVTDIFLNKGLIVYTQGRVKDSELKFSATRGDALNGAPIVVLVNGGSASASEIVAGALQDHKRAIIMGSDTFGKGSVQTIKPLTPLTAIKLTTARYYTPSGRSIQAEGIVPDITLANVSLETKEKDSFSQVKEADLKGHLLHKKTKKSSSEKAKKKTSKSKEDNAEKNDEAKEKTDYALHEALNLLKGLNILMPGRK
ncbi:MAG: S41 family peptidase [gamma proteobacterium symbiont of Bathyaustriella thionipta]|nr:S41 family peptidase [gamma proteobacterium symbiont of Bathyaustriella thionipta]MCU7948827.1 S41 family peptidase [gamma proteobacterium symbiont of Bathyaustriella thionipta]MCU7954362.1 S41 family peptidase [gamma proteobacterium symbiont of Bathyaustriella thionipta]MCU7955285.1 S41 family peptidase [gamma proteobacterium symbiont of Bathyaustriella thionipta]MCU7967452.1 S41 family peptidase [gamma proteobacterium symbiont of Bathyaustriella thionipta]